MADIVSGRAVERESSRDTANETGGKSNDTGEKTGEKSNKVGRLPWIGLVNHALSEGLAKSQWLADAQADAQADRIGAGRQICLDLWPFIKELPDNIKAVMEKLPPTLEPAKLFLSNLADEERNYQSQYIKQCDLAGFTGQDLMSSEANPTPAIAGLVKAMRSACREGDVVSGVQAIVAAELAATQFARTAKDAFEVYFEKHAAEYPPEKITEGLAWVRLHAKLNTRHAIWMNRMLIALHTGEDGLTMPPAVISILASIFAMWRVEPDTARRWLEKS